jgi:hypothetical protein
MFPPGRQMQSLRGVFSTQPDMANGVDFEDWCIDSSDISRIISCCPQLQRLDLTLSVNPDADVSALLQLPASCTSLSVGGAVFNDDAPATIAQLTQLQRLMWFTSPGLTDVGLQQL